MFTYLWQRKNKQKKANNRKGLSLKTVLIVPFILQIGLVILITGWLSFQNGYRSIENITNKLSQEIASNIKLHIQDYLDVPHQFNQSQESIFQRQWLKGEDLNGIGGFLVQQIHTKHSLQYTAWGNEQGQYVGISKVDLQGYEIELVEDPTTQEYRIYKIGLDGQRGKLLRLSSAYDPRTRPWYREAKQAGIARWSSIYVWFDNSKTAIDAVLPIYSNEKEFIGVLDTPISLSEISSFLKGLQIGETGIAFILERDGKLVASSTQDVTSRSQDGKIERVNAIESKDKTIATIAKVLTSKSGGFTNLREQQNYAIDVESDRHFLQLLPFQDKRGLDWLIVIDIPARDFTESFFTVSKWTLVISTAIVVTAFVILLGTANLVVNRIMKMIQQANAIANGEWQSPMSEIGTTELKLLAKSFNQMSSQLQSSFDQIKYTASHDLLTRLPNRITFLDALKAEISKQNNVNQSEHKSDELFAILFFDLDNFKRINDSFGHIMGDMLLRDVTERIQSILQPEDLLSRFGGDEFTILLRNLNSSQSATVIAQKIVLALRQPFLISGDTIFVSTSIGISVSTSNYELPDSYLRDADTAMYFAKKGGKDRYEIFGALMNVQIVERLRLETELRHSLDREELLVYYQPIISLQSDRMIGFEALVRWDHPVHGFVSPSKFIQIAEESGQISRLTRFILRRACMQLKQWQAQFPCANSLILNVNLSSRDFIDKELVSEIEKIISETQLSPHNLKLELTESIMAGNMEAVGLALQQLRSLGIGICIDDFGTGYCSLQYLLLLPATTLKIDRVFIEQLIDHPQAEEIIALFVNLAHSLKMEAVVEGIEVKQQADIIKRLNCDFGQGYLWSPPVPAGAITEMLRNL